MKKLYLVILTILLISCHTHEVLIVTPPSKKSVLRIEAENNQGAAILTQDEIIKNVQILTFNENGICTQTIPIPEVTFDDNNYFEVAVNIPLGTTKVTVLGNTINYTVPTQDLFLGKNSSEIFVYSQKADIGDGSYFFQPQIFFEGSMPITDTDLNSDYIMNIKINRIISNIIVQLDPSLSFSDNNGKGFFVKNSTMPITINEIDSVFVVNTPSGVNISVTEYLDKVGFKFCQVLKQTSFTPNSKNQLSDNIYVMPQINAGSLPFIILSVKGYKGNAPIKSLYYAIQPTISGSDIKSLGPNNVLSVTIKNFIGDGTPQIHPEPNQKGIMIIRAAVTPWGNTYNAEGDAD